MKKLFSGLYDGIRHTSITGKIRRDMILISISILTAFMTISIFYSYKNMMEDSIDSAYKNLVFAQNNLDNMLNMIDNYSLILLSDENIQNILTQKHEPNPSQLSKSKIEMRTRINAIFGSYSTINAILIYDNWGNIYDSGITLLKQDTSAIKGSNDKDNTASSIAIPYSSPSAWISTHPASYYIAVPGKTIQPDVITFVRRIHDYKTGRQIGTLEICIDESSISNTYVSSINDSESMYMVLKNNQIISHPTPEKLYTNANLNIDQLNQEMSYLKEKDTYIIYKRYDTLDSYIISEIPTNIILKKTNQMFVFMILAGISLIGFCIAISGSLSKSITKNLSKLTSAISKISSGNWDVKVNITSDDEIGILTRDFNRMIDEIQSSTKNLVQEQKSKREFQLELLNQQINPHFLYNTLDNICALAELNRTEELLSMVDNLTHFYRGVLSKGSIVIPLSQELKIAASYLNIMQIRYYKSFIYHITIPEGLNDNTCLRLTLQPLLENSIYHGFQSHEPGGHIQISARVFTSFIILVITDNGVGMDRETLSSIRVGSSDSDIKKDFGLLNVHERIQLYYGMKYGMKIFSVKEKGTRILIKIPKKSGR